MKKILIKIVLFIVVLISTIFISAKLINKGHSNLTMEMSKATLPVITMSGQGYNYNRLWGYTGQMDSSMMWENVTVLGDNRETSFTINTYGQSIESVDVEVRSTDATRLIEKNNVTDLSVSQNEIKASIVLKDLIEENTPYSLIIILTLEDGKQVNYYTKVYWNVDTHISEKLDFVMDFHNRTFDKEAAKEITKYLETNSKLEKNTSFHKVNIHSSFKQVTWGDLNVSKIDPPVINVSAISNQTASIVLDYQVVTTHDKNVERYFVKEYYRVRYTSDRIYLLDFERTMTQLPNIEKMCSNNKIALGITDENVNMMENEDGSVVAFEAAGKLFSYNQSTNKLAILYSYYDDTNSDERAYNNNHSIKIFDVDESGNVWFAVYGYVNRGQREGRVGLQIYMFDSQLNTTEELIYVNYDKCYSVLKAKLDKLLFMNRDQMAYFYIDNQVYMADLVQKTYENLLVVDGDNTLQVADNNKIICWQNGNDIYSGTELTIKNLSTNSESTIRVSGDEAIMPLGFIDEDVIYGVAKKVDVVKEITGATFFPMYKICICNTDAVVLKEYSENGIYVTDCSLAENQITLKRVKYEQEGYYKEINDDHIMNNTEVKTGRNIVASADIDVFERFVQIQTKAAIETKTLKVLTPKEVVYEGGREINIEDESTIESFYVFGAYGVQDIYLSPANAVIEAYETSGIVIDSKGNCIWIKGNRLTRNQIMAITEKPIDEGENSMSVCLNTVLEYEGVVRNTTHMLQRGQTAVDILKDSLEETTVLDLTGCNLDSVLYYVNKDIPVIVTLSSGDAVLITGFNEFNIVVMDPQSGSLYKKGLNDATEWFNENGNRFVTYISANN